MNQEEINKIQSKVIKLLTSQGDGALSILSSDCCSEMTRLVGGWIQNIYEPDKIFILKGVDLKNAKHPHDVLAISKNTKISIIDPTVWQFFPDGNIFIGNFENLKKSILNLNKIYGGQWKISEELANINKAQMKEWKRLITNIITENISKSI